MTTNPSLLSGTEMTTDATLISESETEMTSDATLLSERETEMTSDATLLSERETDMTTDATLVSERETDMTSDATLIPESEAEMTTDASLIAKSETEMTNDASLIAESETEMTTGASLIAESETEIATDAILISETDSSAVNGTEKATDTSLISVTEKKNYSSLINETKMTADPTLTSETTMDLSLVSLSLTPTVINICGRKIDKMLNDNINSNNSNSNSNKNNSRLNISDETSLITCKVSKGQIKSYPLFSFSLNGAAFDKPVVGGDTPKHYVRRLRVDSSRAGRHSVRCRVIIPASTDLYREIIRTVLVQEPPSLPPLLTIRSKTFQGITKSDLSVTSRDLSDPGEISCTVKGGYPAAKLTYHGCGWQYDSTSSSRFMCSCRAKHSSGCYSNGETSVTLTFKDRRPDETSDYPAGVTETSTPTSRLRSTNKTQFTESNTTLSNQNTKTNIDKSVSYIQEKSLLLIVLILVIFVALTIIVVLIAVIVSMARKRKQAVYDVEGCKKPGNQRIIFTEISSV